MHKLTPNYTIQSAQKQLLSQGQKSEKSDPSPRYIHFHQHSQCHEINRCINRGNFNAHVKTCFNKSEFLHGLNTASGYRSSKMQIYKFSDTKAINSSFKASNKQKQKTTKTKFILR